MSVYRGHPELFEFVDETGADRRDTMRKFAYNIRATTRKLLVHGHSVSAWWVCHVMEYVLDFSISTTTNTSHSFEHYVRTALLPYLQPLMVSIQEA
jgi:hypothetical protein